MATKDTTKNAKSADLSVLKNPRVTEKAANASAFSVYLFDVAATATKSEIAKAFQAVYEYKPLKVNTVTMARKSFFRRGKLGFGTKGKKAYVFLPKGTTINI
jgi:large subunit ribosomal protein L23